MSSHEIIVFALSQRSKAFIQEATHFLVIDAHLPTAFIAIVAGSTAFVILLTSQATSATFHKVVAVFHRFAIDAHFTHTLATHFASHAPQEITHIISENTPTGSL